jgi:hydroxypyruvate reductase
MNALRKHLSRVKGGRLAEALSPSRIISLVLSDVVGDDLSVIASGPTCPDDSSFEDVDRILKKYQITDRLPRSVRGYLERGLRGEAPETLKRDHPVFSSVTHRVVGNNLLACRACEVKARDLGYHTLVLSDSIQGEARECAVFHAGIVRSISRHNIPVEKPACVISGGENTVTVTGTGMGGRNQEFCLAMIPWIGGLRDVAVLSAGTDGNDGPTDAAGAIVTGQSLGRSKTVGLDVDRSLRNNDSYHFLEQIGALLRTGPTNTNVMDLRILLVR